MSLTGQTLRHYEIGNQPIGKGCGGEMCREQGKRLTPTYRTGLLRWIHCLFIAFSCLVASAYSREFPGDLDQEARLTQTPAPTAANLAQLGDEQWKAGKTEQATATFLEAIRLDPQYEPSYLGLALLLNQTGKHDEQLAVLYSARQLIPASAQITTALMQALFQAHRYDDEIKVGREYLAGQHKDAMVFFHLGEAYTLLKQYNNAIAALEEATKLDDKLSVALFNLGALYKQAERYEDALHAARRILEGAPQFYLRDETWLQMVAMLERLGRIGEASAEIDKELRLHPKSAYALFLRADIRHAQNLFEDAVADLKQALALSAPPDLQARIYFSLSNSYLAMSRFSDVIEMATKCVDLAPDNEGFKELRFHCYAQLATAYGMSSRCEQSIDAFGKAISIKPDDIDVYNNLSICLKESGSLPDAERALR